ncbi:MAG: hypothetical protein KF910_12380 [Brevundimonas sp.]|uniref:hypothetical protein n=1 Tax=Brevundimonas sp. TaxID=1871086 RepID=UPI0025C2767A|nr:hypothetical protein [Brevundimonas sp.]MBX3478402.1 hypothetical protein [Brevundimonas sp.]
MPRNLFVVGTMLLLAALPVSALAQDPVGVVRRAENVIALMYRPDQPSAGFDLFLYPRPAPGGEIGRHYRIGVMVTCEDGTVRPDGTNSLISASGSYIRQYDAPFGEALSGMSWDTLRSDIRGYICDGRALPVYRPNGEDDLMDAIGTAFQRGGLR